MSKTADVLQGIWTDPWFLNLPADAKTLYLWTITTAHGNQAGLYVVARPIIELETGLTADKLRDALAAVGGKVRYDEPTGTLWVVGKAKRVRSKTEQIAKSIAKAVADCPSPVIAAEFAAKYGQLSWLARFMPAVAEPRPPLAAVEPATPDDAPEAAPKEPGAGLRFRSKPVPAGRKALAEKVLADFNEQGRLGYKPYTGAGTASDALSRILGALTDWPDDIDEERAGRMVRWFFRGDHWWTGEAKTGMLFGPGQVEAALAATAGKQRASGSPFEGAFAAADRVAEEQARRFGGAA